MIRAQPTLEYFNSLLPFQCSVLDVGSGSGEHARLLKVWGKHEVETVDPYYPATYVASYPIPGGPNKKYNGIWCSHTLEHQVNPGIFLQHLWNDLQYGGILAITVPPRKDRIVGGHVTLWNAGLLLYNLILAGFDCSKARVAHYDQNISVIVEKGDITDISGIICDNGDIVRLAKYFPFPAREGFNGITENINWEWPITNNRMYATPILQPE